MLTPTYNFNFRQSIKVGLVTIAKCKWFLLLVSLSS